MSDDRLPWAGLLALSVTAFTTLMTETLPAGVLPAMSRDLHESPSHIGMLVSYYAIAAAMSAIPLMTLTRGWPRRTFLMGILASTAVVNLITAFSNDYVLTVATRIVAGFLAGTTWPLVVTYAARIAAPHQRGRAVAVAMTGGTVALSLGIPGGAILGQVIGWRATFVLLAFLAVALLGWIYRKVPPFPGQARADRIPLLRILKLPGIPLIFSATLLTILANYSLYTYVAPLAEAVHLGGGSSFAFFLFGAGAFTGITLVARFIDAHLRTSALLSIGTGVLIFGTLGAFDRSQLFTWFAIFVWGISFGSAPTIYQAAANRAAGKSSDVTSSILTTVYSIGIFGGGWLGGIWLETAHAPTLPWLSCGVISVAFLIVFHASRNAFPARSWDKVSYPKSSLNPPENSFNHVASRRANHRPNSKITPPRN